MTKIHIIFKTFQEAQEAYYKTHDCISDDWEKEENAILRWIETNGYSISDEN